MAKKLYYEVIEDEKEAPECTALETAEAAVPERDRYGELIAAARRIKSVRFRVSPDYRSSVSSITLMMSLIIAAGAIFMLSIKNSAGQIVIAVLIVIAIVLGVAAMINTTVKSKKVWYCYYINDEKGFICVSVIEDRAVVFDGETAYRIDGEAFYTLDPAGFTDYLDGESCGIVSVLAAKREDVEFDGEAYFVKNRLGGGHHVVVEDGEIRLIESEQPYETDDIDQKTGARKIKTKVFVKSDPVYDFPREVPAFVKDRLAQHGIELNLPTETQTEQ